MMRIYLVVLTIMMLGWGCKSSIGLPPQTQIKVINTSINSGALDLYFDGALMAESQSFGSSTDYFFTASGSPIVKVMGRANGITYASGQMSFLENTNYTLVIADSVQKMKVSVLQDTVTSPAAGKANIRFIHLNTDKPTVDFYVGSTALSINRTFNDHNGSLVLWKFSTIDSGKYTIQAKNTTGGSTLVSLPNISLQSGKIYTVVLKGTSTATVSTDLPSFIITTHN